MERVKLDMLRKDEAYMEEIYGLVARLSTMPNWAYRICGVVDYNLLVLALCY